MVNKTEEPEERIPLGFGWFLGRRASKKSSPADPMRASGKIAEQASNAKALAQGSKVAAESFSNLEQSAKHAAQSLGSVIRGSEKRYTNGLSGAPDNGKREPSNDPALPNPRSLAGRKSVENPNQLFAFNGIWESFSERKGELLTGISPDFSLENLSTMNIDALADLMADLSPEISKALWDFIILSNPGYELKAYKNGTEEIDQVAQDALDAIHAQLGFYQGSVGVFFDRLFKVFFLRGAYLMELVLADNGRDFVDVATPDTATLTFRRLNDPQRGQIWDFGQHIQNEFVSLNIPTIRYIPLHPHGNSIEGHSVCTSAFFVSIFLMTVLRDTKRVIEHQGYLRLDIEILFKELTNLIPTEIQANPEAITRWQEQVIDAVAQLYSSLEPDDTYVHGDGVKVNKPVGSITSDSLNAIDGLFQALERMAVRALKSVPLLMGTNQSRTETQANREWEIYAKGIETIQHYVETGFEYICSLALRAQGIQADVRLRFARFRAAEAMRDEQVATLKATRARYLYDCGIISQDEMANIATDGKRETADQPEPRNLFVPAPSVGGGGFGGNSNPNQGEGRAVPDIDRERWLDDYIAGRQPTEPELDEAAKFLEDFGDDATQDFFDAEVATSEEQGEVETV